MSTPLPNEPIGGSLITGFLGSGKTTLLNRLLRHPGMGDTAVIVNEFGEVGLDHLLIDTALDDAVLLKSGCLCCTLRGDLVDTLGSLFDRRQRGEVPAFRRVLIETTGLADPTPILHALMADPGVTRHYRMGHVVTTVDAVNALGQLARHYESAKQAAVADRLVLTKSDLASPTDIAAVTAQLRALNATAPIFTVVHGAIEPDALFPTAEDERSVRMPVVEPHDQERDHPAHDDHRHGISSHCLIHDHPLHWPRFAHWLEALASLRGSDLLRVKGIISVEGRSRPVVIHGVQHVLHLPRQLQDWPDADRRSRIVFITRDITFVALEQSFRASVAG
ncbi:MAG TPA: GTP-binding protein [Stellaceae bacterium]|nr:GTP-binding protein [Stellaceae bacterium]